MDCYTCGDSGHISRDCPNQAIASDGRPSWCGICDQRTRHLELPDGRATRCPRCHPLRDRTLAQHKRCHLCHATVTAWDSSPDCGHHILGGVRQPYVPVAREYVPPPDSRELAARQAAEARAARALV